MTVVLKSHACCGSSPSSKRCFFEEPKHHFFGEGNSEVSRVLARVAGCCQAMSFFSSSLGLPEASSSSSSYGGGGGAGGNGGGGGSGAAGIAFYFALFVVLQLLLLMLAAFPEGAPAVLDCRVVGLFSILSFGLASHTFLEQRFRFRQAHALYFALH